MSCSTKTHVLRIQRPSGQRTWHNLVTGQAETDAAVITRLEAQLLDEKCKKEAEVFVVRLDGSKTGASVAKIEGDTLTAADIGNTFTLTGEYLSYATQWLGDSEQDAVLDWNDISYLAGIGSGSALYQHALLPALTDSENLIHDDEIVLTAQAGAFVEFRFKRLQ